MRDWPRSAGFSSTRTRRSASLAVMSSADSITMPLTSLKRQIAGAHCVFGSLPTSWRSFSHSGAMLYFPMRS